MLIYNHKKEFLGIDAQDLKKLGFNTLQELREEAADFADFFVKTPGHVHNFKHVHWIDFISCAESHDESKVIIYANKKSFRCDLDLKTIFLLDNPSQKAYHIELHHLRELSDEELKVVSNDILEKPAPKVAATTVSTPIENSFDAQKVETPTTEITADPYAEDIKEPEPTQAEEKLNIIEDMYEDDTEVLETKESAKIELDLDVIEDKPLDIMLDDPVVEEVSQELETIEDLPIEIENNLEVEEESDFTLDLEELPTNTANDYVEELTQEIEEEEEEDSSTTYIYDPNVASGELGLPVDLIEEFIEDFIAQAKEFKDDLYDALDKSDMERLKTQSHKLKGVAANLRVENALEALSIINTSEKHNEIAKNLKLFYKIIAVLAGEAPVKKPTQVKEIVSEVENDDLVLDVIEESQDIMIEEEVSTESDELVLEFKDETQNSENDLYVDNEHEAIEPLTLSLDEEKDDANTETLMIDLDEDETTVDEPLTLSLNEEKDDVNTEALMIDLNEDETTDEKVEPLMIDLEESISTDESSTLIQEEKKEKNVDAFEPLMIDLDEEIQPVEPILLDEISEIEEKFNYNKETVANEIGLDLESFNELFIDYIEDCETSSQDIHKAIQNSDYETWSSNALRVKGMSDNMKITQFTKELENLIHTKDTNEALESINKIDRYLKTISKMEA